VHTAGRPVRGGDHPSGPTVAGGLERPTRVLGRAALGRTLSGLAPDGVYRAAPVARRAGGLLHHLFTLTRSRRTGAGGLFSVALSCGSPRVGVAHHPALRSPDFPRPAARSARAAVTLNPDGLALRPRLTLPSRPCVPDRICLVQRPTGLEGVATPGPSPPRPPIALPGMTPGNGRARNGNLDPLSIAYGASPRLRPASPAADQQGCGTLGHSVGGIRTPLALLMPTFALPAAPRRFPPSLLG
jgi:hypothetical protein